MIFLAIDHGFEFGIGFVEIGPVDLEMRPGAEFHGGFFRRGGELDEARHRLAVLGNDDFLSRRCVFDELGEVCLCFVEIDLFHEGECRPVGQVGQVVSR
jgi:hypothetical protein